MLYFLIKAAGEKKGSKGDDLYKANTPFPKQTALSLWRLCGEKEKEEEEGKEGGEPSGSIDMPATARFIQARREESLVEATRC